MTPFSPAPASEADTERMLEEVSSLRHDAAGHALPHPICARLCDGFWIALHPPSDSVVGPQNLPVSIIAEFPTIVAGKVRKRLQIHGSKARSTLRISPADLAVRGVHSLLDALDLAIGQASAQTEAAAIALAARRGRAMKRMPRKSKVTLLHIDGRLVLQPSDAMRGIRVFAKDADPAIALFVERLESLRHLLPTGNLVQRWPLLDLAANIDEV